MKEKEPELTPLQERLSDWTLDDLVFEDDEPNKPQEKKDELSS